MKKTVIIIFSGTGSSDISVQAIKNFRKFNPESLLAIVSPNTEIFKSFDLDFLINDSDFDFIKNLDLSKFPNLRQGWYKQQLMKLTAPFLLPNNKSYDYVMWDGDTVPVRRITFFKNSFPVINLSKTEYHWPYFITNREILGGDYRLPFSSISQYMPYKYEEWASLVLNHGDKVFCDITSVDVEKFVNSILSGIVVTDGTSDFSEQEFFSSWRIKNNIGFNTTTYKIIRYGALIPAPISIKLALANFLGAINISFEAKNDYQLRDFFRGMQDFLR